MLRRLDAELVHRKLARSREHAQQLIGRGCVELNGVVATKPATQAREGASIRVRESEDDRFVSRGAHKLIGALDRFQPRGLVVAGRDAMDAGASTGGFTQVLLERGANRVAAVDVGYGVLAWPVRTDPRVHVFERMNVRHISAGDLPFTPELIVADLSFISLRTVLDALAGVAAPNADLVLMVKPQFEVGRASIGDGVVREPALRARAVHDVADAMQALGFGVQGIVASPLPGPSGNVEYFVWATRGVELDHDLSTRIAAAVSEGPQ